MNNLFQKVCGTVYASTDNLLITVLLGIKKVGLVGNYTMLSGYVTIVMTKLMSPFQMSIGDYVHSVDGKDGLKLFVPFVEKSFKHL